jgi:hypothetical protein
VNTLGDPLFDRACDSATSASGGSWGSSPVILETITADTARLPRVVPVRGAELTGNPSLAGARIDALSRLRSDIIAAPRPTRH